MIKPLPLRLNNLYAKIPTRSSISAWISTEDHDYVVRGILAGEHGAVQAILSHLWHKFVLHVRDTAKLLPYWNLDDKNPERIAVILSKLNFEDATDYRFTYELLADENMKLKHELSTLQPQRPRRTNPSPSKSTKQSPPRDRKRSGTRRSNNKVPHVPSSTESTEGGSHGKGHSEA